MALRRILQPLDRIVTEHPDAVALIALVISLALRFHEGAQTYLNPDEAHYFEMSIPNGIGALYQSALDTHHPALYIILMHWIGKVSEHELALRSVAMASGTLFPWFLYRWLSLVWSRLAGLLALLLVAFAPPMISLSAQARGYTLAFLAICACLYFQERALRESSSRWMAFSGAALCVGIVTEYFVAFFAVAAGIAFLLRARKQPPPGRLWQIWAAGQACGVVLYGFLFVTQILPMLSTSMGQAEQEAWLHGTFPWPGDNLAVFLYSAVIKQFLWLFASNPLGHLMRVASLAGLWFLWKGPSRSGQLPSRLTIALTVTMFALTAVGSTAHFHPFGESRHTGFLGIFIAAVIAIAFERLIRRSPGILLPAALVLLPAWNLVANEDPNNIPRARHQRDEMLAGIQYLRANIPAGSAILMDEETRLILAYYMDVRRTSPVPHSQALESGPGGYRFASYRLSFRSTDEIAEDARRFRADYFVPADTAVWLIDGGWNLFKMRKDAQQQHYEITRFGNVLWILRVPAERRPGAAS